MLVDSVVYIRMVIRLDKAPSGTIKRIQEIEISAYPSWMLSMQGAEKSDIADYCEVGVENVIIISGDDYYAIVAKGSPEAQGGIEVVDICSVNGSTSHLFEMLSELFDVCAGNSVVCDVRERTYRLALHLQRSGRIKIESEEEWVWGDETMRSLFIRV